ncbi:shikimate kinase [Aquimarina sp. AU474]|uniref:shikimate kinase n=1 Tax=Aquimarina sp. AU474 TaxID=2108529 RepID=UPI000D687E97|nr:shikimate kinase [Aquimarina sp. AU474]
MILVLIGYMGCGKSLIGNDLAAKVSYDYVDLDDYIENQEHKSIKDIFKNNGEIYFRKKETLYLNEVLNTLENAILSLGGGTPCFAGNLEIIKEHPKTKVVYLKTSLDELTKRLFNERNKRPLLAHLKTEFELKDFIRKHLFERSFYYNQADLNVSTDEKNVEQISEEIISSLL